jgi:hypothetical protein
VGAFASVKRHIQPTQNQVENIEPAKVPRMWEDFMSTRSGQDKILPSKVQCNSSPEWPHFNVPWRWAIAGWQSDCVAWTLTEVFLGVRPKQDDSYVVRFVTEGMEPGTRTVYVNGRLYTAHKVGDTFEAKVHIPHASLSSPTILVSIEWQRRLAVVPGKLLEISIE